MSCFRLRLQLGFETYNLSTFYCCFFRTYPNCLLNWLVKQVCLCVVFFRFFGVWFLCGWGLTSLAHISLVSSCTDAAGIGCRCVILREGRKCVWYGGAKPPLVTGLAEFSLWLLYSDSKRWTMCKLDKVYRCVLSRKQKICFCFSFVWPSQFLFSCYSSH